MTRLAAAVLLTVTTGVTVVLSHKRPAPVSSATLAPVIPFPDRASRSDVRRPLPGVEKPRRRAPVRRPGPHSTPGSGALADVTAYCATGSRNAAGRWPQLGDVAVLDRSIPFGTRVLIDGNAYTVEDWIGSGSSWDLFFGSDAGCEQRALNFGRQHLRVVVER